MQPRERLSSREIEVATMVWQGHTNRDITREIGTSEQVVKNYLRTTFDKLGVWSRLELALYISHHGGEQWTEPKSGLRNEKISLPRAGSCSTGA